jgi:hypothetical protein
MRTEARRGSWLSLVVLCAVSAFSAALAFGMLFAGASVVFAVVHPSALSEETQPAVQVSAPDQLQANVLAAELQQASLAKPANDNTAPPPRKNFAGIITDSHCGARHTRFADKTSAECARLCVRSKGSHWVLVDGEEIHGLQGDRTQLDRLAAVRVDIVGKLVGDTIRVESISARSP